MGIVIGIDVGGSTTKIVGFKRGESGLSRIEPQFVRANDPITATYGAFGKFTDENGIAISDIERVMMTGFQHSIGVSLPMKGTFTKSLGLWRMM